MSRPFKFLLLIFLLVFVLACNIVSQPVNDVQNLAGTAEAIASAIPMETLQALPSALPIETVQAGIPTDIANLEEFNYVNPQGTPLSEWRDVPIMPGATVGQEFNEYTYSFKIGETPEGVKNYYKAILPNRGWTSQFDLPVANDEGGLMLYVQGDNLLTISITVVDGETVVILTFS